MTAPPRRIGLVLHPTRDVTRVLETIARWARRHGVTPMAASGRGRTLPGGIEAVPLVRVAASSDMLLAVGGDGTLLDAMALGTPHGTPVLALGLGSLGYLAEVPVERLDIALEAVAAGRYQVEERATLELDAAGRGPATAFNDVALRRPTGARTGPITLRVDGEPVATWHGDGVVVATAMGSTAYSLSAGGPIVSPRLAATVVTPLAPHAALHPSLVLSAGERLELYVGDEGMAAPLPLPVEIDGRENGRVHPPALVRVRQSAVRGRLVTVGGRGFPARTRSLLDAALLGRAA
jgi:NAD+ kinase